MIHFCLEKDQWGDQLVLNDTWPSNMDTLQILGCNLGGVSYHYDVKAWEQVLGHLYDMQAGEMTHISEHDGSATYSAADFSRDNSMLYYLRE